MVTICYQLASNRMQTLAAAIVCSVFGNSL